MAFTRPFRLGGFERVRPADAYRVQTIEELLQDISFPVCRRRMALIHLKENRVHPGGKQTLTTGPQPRLECDVS